MFKKNNKNVCGFCKHYREKTKCGEFSISGICVKKNKKVYISDSSCGDGFECLDSK